MRFFWNVNIGENSKKKKRKLEIKDILSTILSYFVITKLKKKFQIFVLFYLDLTFT